MIVNNSKTKFVAFGSGPALNSNSITSGKCDTEIVDIYTYLGIKLHRQGRQVSAIKM